MSPDDKKPSNIRVALLGDPPEPLLSARRILTGHEAKPGCELPPGPEQRSVRNRGDDRTRGDGADPGNCLEASAQLILPMPGMDLS